MSYLRVHTASAVIKDLLSRVAQVGAAPGDSDETRLRKTLLTMATLAFAAAGLLWGLMYFLIGQPLAAAIPGSYGVLSLITTGLFARLRSYRFHLFSQLLLILFLPFLLQTVLGGYINSSAVILWSLICPVGALIFAGPRQAVGWFAGYLGLVTTSGLLQPYLRGQGELSTELLVVFFVLNISAISALVFFLLFYFIGQRDAAYRLLRLEQEKSESLLLNILPREIAQILKNQGGTIADYYAPVSILFADLVGFTPLASTLTPSQTVELLNEIFTHFDGLVDQFGVEKIETVGDEYVAACGVPRPCPDHAQAVARLALAMCAYITERPASYGQRIGIRIGIHTGPVVGGVIGRKKFAFELFGDTVNTAHRMQAHGEPGRIQISRAAF